MCADHRAVRGPGPTVLPLRLPTVLRWQYWGTNAQRERGMVLSAPASAAGQTERDAWAYYDHMMKAADYTNLAAIAITAHGRITYKRQGRAA